MRLLFTHSPGIAGTAVKTFTWSQYSHVDIVDGDVVIGAKFLKGVHTYPLDRRIAESSKHVFAVIPEVDSAAAIDFACNQIGKPYDIWAIFGFVARRDWSSDDKWFCSELAAAAALVQNVHVLNKSVSRITPQDLLESPLVLLEK